MPSGADLVTLPGTAMVGLIRAVGALTGCGLKRYAIVGGVAVTARLGTAHRATADVDTVVDDSAPPDAVEALLTRQDAVRDPTAPHRVFVAGTKVEILPIGPLTDDQLEGIPDADALFVAAHAWAVETASPITLISEHDPTVRATAPFATPAALVAMKLHAIESRSFTGQDKRAGDAWDLYRLLLDLDVDGAVRATLAAAPPRLRALVRESVDRVLVSGANRTRGWLRSGDDQMAAITADDLRHAADPLLTRLT